jgi:ribonuclease P protein component
VASKPPRFTLPRRLANRRAFLQVQTHGQRFKGKLMVLLLAPPEAPSEALRFGYTVSRKVGNAVVRNRVRRRLKEGVRLRPEAFSPAYTYVTIAFSQAATAPSHDLHAELHLLARRARTWAERQRP